MDFSRKNGNVQDRSAYDEGISSGGLTDRAWNVAQIASLCFGEIIVGELAMRGFALLPRSPDPPPCVKRGRTMIPS